MTNHFVNKSDLLQTLTCKNLILFTLGVAVPSATSKCLLNPTSVALAQHVTHCLDLLTYMLAFTAVDVKIFEHHWFFLSSMLVDVVFKSKELPKVVRVGLVEQCYGLVGALLLSPHKALHHLFFETGCLNALLDCDLLKVLSPETNPRAELASMDLGLGPGMMSLAAGIENPDDDLLFRAARSLLGMVHVAMRSYTKSHRPATQLINTWCAANKNVWGRMIMHEQSLVSFGEWTAA